MGGMMANGALSAWALVLIVAAVAVTIGGVAVAGILRARHAASGQLGSGSESSVADAAQEALRMRYARGEISREDYLQARVELED